MILGQLKIWARTTTYAALTQETHFPRDCPRCECTHNCQLGDNPDWLAFLWQSFCCHWTPQKGEKRPDKNIKRRRKLCKHYSYLLSLSIWDSNVLYLLLILNSSAAETGRPLLIPSGICNAMHCSGYVSYFKFWVFVPLAGCCSFPVGGAIWQVYCRRGRGRHWQISLLCFFKMLCTALFYFSVLRFHISHQRTQVYCCIVRERGRSPHPPLFTFCLSIHAYTHPNPCLYLYFSILLL